MANYFFNVPILSVIPPGIILTAERYGLWRVAANGAEPRCALTTHGDHSGSDS